MALVLLLFSWLVMAPRLAPSIPTKNGAWKQVKFFDFTAWKYPPYTVWVLGCTLTLFGLYTPFAYVGLFTSAYNIPQGQYMLSILNAASLFGRTIPGALSDRLGRINTVIPHLYICVVLIFIFPLCTNLGGLLTFAIIFGYCSGCYVSLLPAGGEYSGSVHVLGVSISLTLLLALSSRPLLLVAQLGSTANVGTRLGQMFLLMSLGGLLGTPISGAILGTGDDLRWWPAMIYAGCMVLAGTMLIHLARQLQLKTWGLRGKI